MKRCATSLWQQLERDQALITRLLDIFRTPQEDPEAIEPALAAAALMFEVVWADHNIEADELATMQSALQQLFSLDTQRLQEIVDQTRDHHEESVGLFRYTRALNTQLEAAQKYRVVVALWRIALCDQRIDRFEEHMIRRIAELLYVPHQDFIRAKQEARTSTAD